MSNRTRIVVIGGSAAGPKAAARARRLDENAHITIIQKDPDLSMASCGYPYYVGGLFDDRKSLLSTSLGIVRDPDYYRTTKNITARTKTEALLIDRSAGTVVCRDLITGAEDPVPYDRLILATGASPRIPNLPGTDIEGVTTLHNMRDTDYLRKVGDEGTATRAVVVGGGLIGLETCEALMLSGVEVTVVELASQLMAFLDWEMAKLVENYLRQKGVAIITSTGISRFIGEKGKLTGVELGDGTVLACGVAVLAVGVSPNVSLARDAGLDIGTAGGISVDRYLRTSDPNIYAAGDCIEIPHLLTGKTVHAPFGDLANQQGRIAGENAVLGDRAVFPGTIGTGICRLFDYAVGSTGLSERAAGDAGLGNIITAIGSGGDKPSFMNSKMLVTKLIAHRETGRILGAQCLGTGDAAKQIVMWATAIQGKLTVDDIVNADLPYAPPFSPALDHCVVIAEIMQNKMRGLMDGVSAEEVKKRIDDGNRPFLIDFRTMEEYRDIRLGIGETLIPLDELRHRLDELPENREAEIICYCKVSQRGYEASMALKGLGWKNVKVMEGGINAWPYAREI